MSKQHLYNHYKHNIQYNQYYIVTSYMYDTSLKTELLVDIKGWLEYSEEWGEVGRRANPVLCNVCRVGWWGPIHYYVCTSLSSLRTITAKFVFANFIKLILIIKLSIYFYKMNFYGIKVNFISRYYFPFDYQI